MVGIRRDVATLGAGWDPALEWYARAVTAMAARSPDDRTSWRYLAAVHGFDRAGWIARGIITAGDPLPSVAEQGRLWDQCQHAGWYFLPWHRGYLAFFEAIVAKTVADLGGPADWALPYWNYLDTTNPQARRIPQPFRDAAMPGGQPNPLAWPPRSSLRVLGPTPWFPMDIDLRSMAERRYTAAQGTAGFGGIDTGFAQFGSLKGSVESNPHDRVHVMLGGTGGGFMGDPNFAGLDPIFWLHHCNIDRLWEAWLNQPGNVQENRAQWRDGPFPRRFEMPDAAGNLVVFTPAETLPGGPLAPTYDDLTAGTGLGVLPAGTGGAAMPASFSSEPPPTSRLAAANSETLTIGVGGGAAATTVRFAAEETNIAGDPVDQRVFLNLENVRGAAPSGVLNVYVSLPEGGAFTASLPEHVDSVALFGLGKATAQEGTHGGNGFNVAIDITGLARRLAQQGGVALESLEIRLEQPQEGPSDSPITVERVSIYKQPAG